MIDGFVIRELSAADRAAVAFSLRHLGERSAYQRYLRLDDRLAGAEARRVTDLDHWHHEGLIAFATAPRAPIGVVEYVRLEEFDTAELAISVVDGWQRQGVGRQLAFALRERALRAGIRRFRATILRGNRGALAIARALGRCTVLSAEGNAAELLVEL
jgi:RimJ/RimL family protein N-acetyltransferase